MSDLGIIYFIVFSELVENLFGRLIAIYLCRGIYFGLSLLLDSCVLVLQMCVDYEWLRNTWRLGSLPANMVWRGLYVYGV